MFVSIIYIIIFSILLFVAILGAKALQRGIKSKSFLKNEKKKKQQ